VKDLVHQSQTSAKAAKRYTTCKLASSKNEAMKCKHVILASMFILAGLNNSFAQNLHYILSLLETKSINQFYREIKESSECTDISYNNFKRDIVNDFIEHMYSCSIDDTTTFKIKLISKDSVNIFFNLDYEENYTGIMLESHERYINNSIFNYANTKYIDELDLSYKTTFGENLDFTQLWDHGLFGTSFGFSGQPTVGYSMLDEYINSKDTISIMRMVGSSVWETQLFGVLGIVELKKKGFQWGTIEIERAKAVMQKKGMVLNVEGCNMQFTEIDDIIRIYGLNLN
jgi:hypothetical protein